MAQPPAGQTPFDTLTDALGGLLAGHCLTSVTNVKIAEALGETRTGERVVRTMSEVSILEAFPA
jgi:hypothetical protein